MMRASSWRSRAWAQARSMTLMLCLMSGTAVSADDQLVFGAFRSESNAVNWAKRLTSSLGSEMRVQRVVREGETLYRVQSAPLATPDYETLARRASTSGIEFWRLRPDGSAEPGLLDPPSNAPRLSPPARVERPVAAEAPEPEPKPSNQARIDPAPSSVRSEWETELGLESRGFGEDGDFGQSQWSGSVRIQPEYYRAWDDDRQTLTFTGFLRADSEDSRRSHGDVRELFYSRVGDSWDLHLGVRRVFWGVTEFQHLVDIVNQTDLVENLDGEDKLGQPMAQLSLVRDWGVLDVFALFGARERTFPGDDGRFRASLPIHSDARFESGAETRRTDAAIRWSHHAGPFEFALHHFSGTSRDPLFVPVTRGAGLALEPFYPVIDQTGADAQAIWGDWAFKLEAMSRSGFGDRYAAAVVGLERTLVGVFGTAADFGIVAEYMYDERDEDAFNTLFEHDVALGGRLALNDFAQTQALIGIIFDTEYDEYIFSLEASRQLTDAWQLEIEGRVFGGGRKLRPDDLLRPLVDAEFKSAPLQRDDYLQLEFVRYF